MNGQNKELGIWWYSTSWYVGGTYCIIPSYNTSKQSTIPNNSAHRDVKVARLRYERPRSPDPANPKSRSIIGAQLLVQELIPTPNKTKSYLCSPTSLVDTMPSGIVKNGHRNTLFELRWRNRPSQPGWFLFVSFSTRFLKNLLNHGNPILLSVNWLSITCICVFAFLCLCAAPQAVDYRFGRFIIFPTNHSTLASFPTFYQQHNTPAKMVKNNTIQQQRRWKTTQHNTIQHQRR